MKRILKIVGVLFLVLILVGLGASFYVGYALPRAKPAPELSIEPTPERLERGSYLANSVMGCLDCHAQRDFTKYTAPVIPGTEGAGGEVWNHEMGFAGTLYAPNITPAGLKDWTDGEIYRAITQGVDKDGEALFPIMPYGKYGKLADEDLYAVIAYLRTLKPVLNEVPERNLDFPLNLIVNTIPGRVEKLATPNPYGDKVIYGEYVTTAAACTDCHTPQEKGQYLEGMEFAGGFEFPMPNGIVSVSANLTPDLKTGIGNWTEAQFVQAFKQHANRALCDTKVLDGEFNSMMPWEYYSSMEENDLRAVFAYLQSLKPIENKIEKMKVASVE